MINENYFFLVVTLLSLGTFTIRASFIAFSARLRVSPEARELFTYIPAAIFPALILPQTFFHHGDIAWLGGKERLVVLFFAVLLCTRFRSTLAVISFGLCLLFILRMI